MRFDHLERNRKTRQEKVAREQEFKLVSPDTQSVEDQVAQMSAAIWDRVQQIERDAGLSEDDIADVRESLGVSERLKNIEERAHALLDSFKSKLSGLLRRERRVGSSESSQEYSELKDYLKLAQREMSAPVIEEAKRKRDQLLEARGVFSMSKDVFMEYFSSKDFNVRADLEQKNVGDCYAVAAIHAMSNSPHFEMICRSSMKRLADGTWQVRIPLLDEHAQTITITPEELLPQKNKKFLKREKHSILPDLRKKLMPVKGKEGLQVLEAAFIKAKFGSVDRLAAEGGWGDDVLLTLGGDNFIRYSITSSKKIPGKDKWEYPGLSSLEDRGMAYLDHYIENFDPEIHIATASTKHGAVIESIGVYKTKGATKFLVPRHAYSVAGVDTEKRIISLANPWNTKRSIELTFEQFKENFSAFSAIRINSGKLLNKMNSLESRAAYMNI